MQKWCVNFRLWHWINALVVSGLLATVLLRKTLLSWRTNSELIKAKLSAIDLEITSTQGAEIAKAIRDPLWDWHVALGIVLAVLVITRIALFFTQSGKRNYQDLKTQSMHKKMVKIGYIVVYGALLFMAASGLSMRFYEVLGLSKDAVHSIKGIHELVFLAVLIFAPLHIIGIVIAENRGEKGIVSDMINGGETVEMGHIS